MRYKITLNIKLSASDINEASDFEDEVVTNAKDWFKYNYAKKVKIVSRTRKDK